MKNPFICLSVIVAMIFMTGCGGSSSNSESSEKCSSGVFRCDGSMIQKCVNETWKNYIECKAGERCNAEKGECEIKNSDDNSNSQECTVGEFKCIGDDSYYCDRGNSLVFDSSCENGCDSSTGECTETPCDSNPCAEIANSTGVCTVRGTSYVCGCNNGYEWNVSKCVKSPCDPKKCFKTYQCSDNSDSSNPFSSPVYSHGTCDDSTGDCICDKGWVTKISESETGDTLLLICESGFETLNNVECTRCDKNNPPSEYATSGCPLYYTGDSTECFCGSGTCYYEPTGDHKLYCECVEGYILEGNKYSGQCRSPIEGDKQIVECTDLPENAHWNTVSNITQTYDGSSWLPSKSGVYNETESTEECRFKCNDGFTYDSSMCVTVGDTKTANCKGLPANAQWNTASSITQTWNGTSWEPTNTGTYNEVASTKECRFKCKTGSEWNESSCIVDPENLPECSSTSATPCKDSATGLIWSGKGSMYTWSNAVSSCDNLTTIGYDDWRLPNISELRTLIQNCSDTVTNASCGVIDTGDSSTSCLTSSCWTAAACTSCSSTSYVYSKFGDTGIFWSSSVVSDFSDLAWFVNFTYGRVNNNKKNNYFNIRCVR